MSDTHWSDRFVGVPMSGEHLSDAEIAGKVDIDHPVLVGLGQPADGHAARTQRDGVARAVILPPLQNRDPQEVRRGCCPEGWLWHRRGRIRGDRNRRSWCNATSTASSSGVSPPVSITIGSARTGKVTGIIPNILSEPMVIDQQGSLYFGDTMKKTWRKFSPKK